MTVREFIVSHTPYKKFESTIWSLTLKNESDTIATITFGPTGARQEKTYVICKSKRYTC